MPTTHYPGCACCDICNKMPTLNPTLHATFSCSTLFEPPVPANAHPWNPNGLTMPLAFAGFGSFLGRCNYVVPHQLGQPCNGFIWAGSTIFDTKTISMLLLLACSNVPGDWASIEFQMCVNWDIVNSFCGGGGECTFDVLRSPPMTYTGCHQAAGINGFCFNCGSGHDSLGNPTWNPFSISYDLSLCEITGVPENPAAHCGVCQFQFPSTVTITT